MPAELLVGIDLGSSGVKAVLLDPERGTLASALESMVLHSDHPGWAEAEPEDWWTAVRALIPRLLDDAGAQASDVAGVAVTGMVPAIVFCDAAGNPLRRAMLQNDARALTEIRELRDQFAGLDLLHLAGGVLTQQSIAPSALWTARHEPQVWGQVKAVCGSYDWLARRLGAAPHVELNWALESTLYSLDLAPIDAIVEATGLGLPPLLPVKRPGEAVGEVSAAAAVATGLAAGTPIVVGGADHVFSAFGAGLTEPGECLVKLGGAGDIMTVSEEPVFDERLYLDHHPIPGRWMPNGCMATSGSLLRWEQTLLGGVDLAELDVAASASEPGALLTLPYFLGEKTPLHDPELRGVVAGLTLASTRGDLHRSLLEATAYGFRSTIDIFAEDGLHVTTTYVSDGGSVSRLWREILASVLNRDVVTIADYPGASLGAAVAAGVGVGAIDSWSYVVGHRPHGEVTAPTPSHVARYGERYHQFLELTDATTSISHLIARSTA
ncbi:MAG TPA: FGGY family carbohydrate kinase [Acidimicrobiales bacterium]|nr:FGGY family carbohydrate kinase [Acidimicrobiales bacterium]